MNIIDISPLISEDIAVFPGDTPFRRQVALSFDNGDHLALSSMATTLHVGAHADAPNHYHPKGVGIAERELAPYIGSCQVIEVKLKEPMARIKPEDLGNTQIVTQRILFKTGSFPNPDRWTDDFTALSPELVHFLADQGVILAGIDTPSVDPAPAKELVSHLAIYERNLAILEGIVLDQVRPGTYHLIALPLKIKGADASPVRAILLEKPIT